MDRRTRRNLRFLATGALAAAGGAAAALRNIQTLRSEPPLNMLGGRQLRWRWRENEIFVTELGSGPPLLLIHGIYAGSSSFEFRRLAPLLAQHYRVIAFDFLGCGLSDRPNISYTAELFVRQILDALAEFTTEPAVLLGSSLGAAFAVRAAGQADERVKAVVAINPTGLEHQDEVAGGLRQASENVLRTPVLGEGLFATLTATRSLRVFLRRVYSSSAYITPEVLAHYSAVTRVPGARYVTAAFIGGSLSCDITSDLPFLSVPLLILWGERARIGPQKWKAAEYAALGNDVQIITYPESGALPHEECPELCAADLAAFLNAKAAGAATFAASNG